MQHVAEPVGEFKHYVEDADTACRKARMDRHRRWFRKYMTWLYAQDDKLPSDKQPEVFGAALRVKYQMHSDITFMELYKLSHRLARKPRERRLAGKPWRTPAEVEAIHENVASATELLTAQVWHGVFGIHCLLVFACVLDEMLRTLKRCVDLGSRDVANRVGLSRRTVSSCLRALCGLRVRQQTPVPVVLLRQARNCADDDVDVTHAFGYQLRPDVTAPHSSLSLSLQNTVRRVPPCKSVWANSAQSTQRVIPREGGMHDAFRSKNGLSKSCALALATIERTSVKSATELAQHTGMRESTARRCITMLRAAGLIEKRAARWHRTRVSLDDVARNRGTLGASDAQRKAHAGESNQYRHLIAAPLRQRKKTLVAAALRVIPRDTTHNTAQEAPHGDHSSRRTEEAARPHDTHSAAAGAPA
jgi:hypothetical protein